MEDNLGGAGSFPISRDPPEGGTFSYRYVPTLLYGVFPISRDPPEGGTQTAFDHQLEAYLVSNF